MDAAPKDGEEGYSVLDKTKLMNENYISRKAGLLIAIAAFTLSSSAQSLKLSNKPTDKITVNGHQVSRFKALKSADMGKTASTFTTTKSQLNAKADKSAKAMRQDICLINEDFSKFTAGSEDAPDTINYVAYQYNAVGWNVDSKWTKKPGYTGSGICSAGGTCALYDPDGYVGAVINTPVGDYSGDVTIKFKVKSYPGAQGAAYININILKGGTDNPDFAVTDEGYTNESLNIYGGDDWREVTITARNYSADNDGFVQILSYGSVIIDDLQVYTSPNFIAAPKLLGVSNFKDTEFTVNWEPVSLAYNYYVKLFKKEYTSDEGVSVAADFEDETLPSNWTFVPEGNCSFSANEGENASKAIVLHNGDTLTTADLGALYKTMNFYLKVVADEDPNDPYALYYAAVNISAKGTGGWEDLGDFYAAYLTSGRECDLVDATYNEFADKYTNVRITVDGLPEGGYLLLDNFDITTGRTYTMTEVTDDYLSYPGYLYDMTDSTHYTFKNLDPVGEYYYNVRSHYAMLESDAESLTYAFGVAAPELQPATEIDARGSYTANWKAAPKATRYLVTNYGVSEAEQDGYATILDEDFAKVDANVTSITDPDAPTNLSNTQTSSLDDYTVLPGWTGRGTTLAQGWLGCEAVGDYSPSIQTPALYLANGDQIKLTIKARGYNGTALVINDGSTDYGAYYTANADGKTGTIDNTFYLDIKGESVTLHLYDYQGYPFMIDYIKIEQYVSKGAKLFTQLESYEATSEETSHRFSGLDKWGYDKYAYSLMSYFDKDGDSVTSDTNRFMIVDLANNASYSGIKDLQSAASAKVVARYSLNGTRLTVPQKGVNILKLSDGRTIKQIVK